MLLIVTLYVQESGQVLQFCIIKKMATFPKLGITFFMGFPHPSLFRIKIKTHPFRDRFSPLAQVRVRETSTQLGLISEAVTRVCCWSSC